MKRRALITGVSGFAGRYLARSLSIEKGTEVFGTYHNSKPGKETPGTHFKMSMGDYRRVAEMIRDVKPDEVYHLAAMSSPSDAADERIKVYESNVEASWILLEALAAEKPDCPILLISSSEVYGNLSPEDCPISETRPAAPLNHYGASKMAMEIIAGRYAANQKMKVMIARQFNHTGPGQSAKFIVPAWAMQVARIEKGEMEPVIRTGNLDVERDFTDVRDATAAYPLLVRHGKAGEVYNVCSGKAVSLRWILKTLTGNSTVKGIKQAFEEARLRKTDSKLIVGSNEKLGHKTGWKPAIPLEKTLADVLEHCRKEG